MMFGRSGSISRKDALSLVGTSFQLFKEFYETHFCVRQVQVFTPEQALSYFVCKVSLPSALVHPRRCGIGSRTHVVSRR